MAKKPYLCTYFPSCPHHLHFVALLSVSAVWCHMQSLSRPEILYREITGISQSTTERSRSRLWSRLSELWPNQRPMRLEEWSGFSPVILKEKSCCRPQNKAFIVCPLVHLSHFSFRWAKDKPHWVFHLSHLCIGSGAHVPTASTKKSNMVLSLVETNVASTD